MGSLACLKCYHFLSLLVDLCIFSPPRWSAATRSTPEDGKEAQVHTFAKGVIHWVWGGLESFQFSWGRKSPVLAGV